MDTTSRENRLAAEVAARLSGCPEAETLQRYHEGELGDAEGEAIAAHLEQCGGCAEALAFLKQNRSEATELSEELPAAVEQVSESLIEATTRGRRPSSSLPTLLQAAAGLALVAALAVGGYQLVGDRGPALNGDLGELRGTEALELVEPVGQLDVRPTTMRWIAHPQADTYRVVLLDANMDEVWVRRTEDATASLILDEETTAPLAGGGQFTWQVEALDSIGATINSSAAAHFEIAPVE